MRALAQTITKRAAGALSVGPRPRGIVALIYHRVGARTGVDVDLQASAFRRQIAALAQRYRPLSIDDASIELESAGPISDGVVVTFDDGTADFVDEALPTLVEHRVPATLYLATDFIERQRAFPDNGTPLSWAGVAEALSTGLVTIGSHSHSHCLFDRINAKEGAEDLDRSIGLIGDRVGVRASHFAYPKALLAAPHVEPEVRKRFTTAAIAKTRPNRQGETDLHRLTRSPIQVSDGFKYFEMKARGGMWLENDLRELVNRWRYRGATE